MKRRKPLRARSDRRIAYEDELDALTPALAARSRGICEVCEFGIAIHRHHRLRRSQGGVNTLANLLHVCRYCHDLIHTNPTLSYDRGWLLRRPPSCGYSVGTDEEGIPSNENTHHSNRR